MKKTAFITGATSGFGEAIARAFAKENFNLIILGRRKDRLERLASELNDSEVHIINVDVRDKEKIFKEIENLPQNFKNIEILVNNAGLALGCEPVEKASLSDFETMIDTNIKGLVYITKAVLPIMSAKKSGYIFNIGSVAGTWPYPGGNVYGATKAFVKQFSLNLRNDIKGSNIRVTNIEPGLCKTEFSLVRFKGDVQKAEAMYENTKYITAENIAQIIINCAKLPENVNINSLEVMATTQSWAGFFFERD